MDEDYPKTLAELDQKLGTESACRDYLFKLRWPDGFVCPRCKGGTAWTTSRNLFVCGSCEHQASLTAGTIFQDTRKPLTQWFRAIWWVTAQKNGASALGLQRILGLGSYKTAWTWLSEHHQHHGTLRNCVRQPHLFAIRRGQGKISGLFAHRRRRRRG